MVFCSRHAYNSLTVHRRSNCLGKLLKIELENERRLICQNALDGLKRKVEGRRVTYLWLTWLWWWRGNRCSLLPKTKSLCSAWCMVSCTQISTIRHTQLTIRMAVKPYTALQHTLRYNMPCVISQTVIIYIQHMLYCVITYHTLWHARRYNVHGQSWASYFQKVASVDSVRWKVWNKRWTSSVLRYLNNRWKLPIYYRPWVTSAKSWWK